MTDALKIEPPGGQPAPLVLDSPHSGLTLPPDFRPAVPPALALRASDAHVEALWAGATAHGAPLLHALFPRSYLDVNRSLADMDPDLLAEPWPEPLSLAPSVRRGAGLIWRIAWGETPMYDRKLSVAEVQGRIARCWRPYHAALAGLLDAAHGRWGAVWHLNCHSMPAVGHSLSPDPAGTVRPDVVLGDLDGASAEPDFTRAAAEAFRDRGYSVALNDPFRGAEIVRRHGRPAEGRHSLQVELNRRLYMDEDSGARHDGFDRLRDDLGAVAAELSAWARAHAGAR